MKLVRMAGARIGLFVMLPKGPHAIDIVNSLGVFRHDPLSNGLLNGALKDGQDWSIIVKHWVHLRWPLKKLQNLALANPDMPRLVLQPLVDVTGVASAADPIIAIEVTDIDRPKTTIRRAGAPWNGSSRCRQGRKPHTRQQMRRFG